jgi:pantetheine-phosphate adenylyltransferase
LSAEDDFQFERTLRHVNEDIHPGIVAVYFMPPRALSEVSSSFIKGLVGPSGWEKVVAKYVPAPVLDALKDLHQRRKSAKPAGK